MSVISNKYRILVVLIGFICLVSICSNYVVMNFTFICMKSDFTFLRHDLQLNETNSRQSLFDYTPTEKKYIMWAVALGTMLGTFPVNHIFVLFGGHWTFFTAGVVSALATLLIPLAAQTSFHALLLARFFQGAAFAADFAAIGLLTVRWAPLSETAIFLGALTMFTHSSSVLTNALSGAICESLGWRAAFYCHAGFGIVAFLMWALIYTDHPHLTPRVSPTELRKIQKNKSEKHLDSKSVDIPYKLILKSPVVLTIWFNAFAEMSIVIFLHTYAPIFFNRVLKFNVAETGILLAVSVFVALPLKLIGGVISDKARCFTEKSKILFFNSLSVGLVGLMICALSFIPSQFRYITVVLFSIIFCCLSLNCAGFYKCATLHTRQYAHIVISTIQWMKSVALITGPALVAWIVKNEESAEQWRIVLCIIGVIMIFANILALFLFTDKPADYTMCEDVAVKYESNKETVSNC